MKLFVTVCVGLAIYWGLEVVGIEAKYSLPLFIGFSAGSIVDMFWEQ